MSGQISGEDMVMAITRTCRHCDYSYQPCKNDNVKSCPQCGGESWDGSVQASVGAYTEFGVTALSQQGQIEGERIKKTDLNTSANLTADPDNPAKISIDRKKRVDKFEEEGVVAEALVDSFNKQHGTNYKIEKKTKEDNEYVDRAFVSKYDKRDRIDVQIRHLDWQIAGEVQNPQKGLAFDGERTAADIGSSIRDAIDAKANVDPKIKAKTILQLILPAPLGIRIRQAIEETRFDIKGFKEVWISPFHEESFPLNCL